MMRIKLNRKLLVFVMIITAVLSQQVFASQPTLVTGTVELTKAATGWLLILIPTVAGLVLGYLAITKATATDQSIISEKNRLMKNVLIGAVLAESASGLVTLILGYYK